MTQEIFDTIKDKIKVKSKYFSIEVRASHEKIKKNYIYVVARGVEGNKIQLLASYRSNRSISIKDDSANEGTEKGTDTGNNSGSGSNSNKGSKSGSDTPESSDND